MVRYTVLSLMILMFLAESVAGEQAGAQERDPVVQAIVEIALDEMGARYVDESKTALRDAHAKAHGCLKAVFTVEEDIQPKFAKGMFAAPGRRHKAWVRFSNGSFQINPDSDKDGRGMAIKIIDSDPMNPGVSRSDVVHDILMINHPVFISPDKEDYLQFVRSGGLTADTNGLRKYFFPKWYNPFSWRLRQARIADKLVSKPVRNPLENRYFSMAPFSFGDDQVVKYSSRPCAEHVYATTKSSISVNKDNMMREAMEQQLRTGTACFDVMVQLRKDGMPIDDVTVEWSEDDSPYVSVGRLTIPSQKSMGKVRADFCENISFSPANTPPGFAPLGSLNHARVAVYRAISKYRHERNKEEVPDPLAEWDTQ